MMKPKYVGFAILTLAIIGILIGGCIQTKQLPEERQREEKLSLFAPTWATAGDEVEFIINSNGNPVEGINISVGEMSAVTDERGIVTFTFEKDGDYEITTNTEGYSAKPKILFEDDFDSLEKWIIQGENDCKILKQGYSIEKEERNNYLKLDSRVKWVYPRIDLLDKEAVALRNYKISLRFRLAKGDFSVRFRNMHRGGSYDLGISQHSINLVKTLIKHDGESRFELFKKYIFLGDSWHWLEILAIKNNFVIKLDEKTIAEVSDKELTGEKRAFLEGAFAIETKSNAFEIDIDKIKVELLSEKDLPLGIIRIYPKGNDELLIRGLREQAVGGEGRAAEDAHRLGANFISINYNLVADPETFELEKQIDFELLKPVISSAHLRGLKVIATTYLWLKDPDPEVCFSYAFVHPPEEKQDEFLENYKNGLLVLAEFAEEEGIDVWILGDRLSEVIGFKKTNKFLKQILPEIRKRYSGKLIADTNYWEPDECDELDQTGFDYIALSTGPEDDYAENYKKYLAFLECAKRLKEKYNKPLIATWVDYSANDIEFLKQEERKGRTFGEVKAKMYSDFYEATKDVFDGYVFARVFERHNNKLVTVTTEGGEEFVYGYMGPETEEKIKEIFTTREEK